MRRQMQLLHFEIVGSEAESAVDVDLVGGTQFMAGIAGCLRGDAPLISVRIWRVGFGGEDGATFAVIEQAGARTPKIAWRLDPQLRYELGDERLVATDMVVEQALGELQVSLGLEPELAYKWPRPGFMSEFHWDPPL